MYRLFVGFLALVALSTFTSLSNADVITSSGTGFVVNGDGWIVTNAHVVNGCKKIGVSTLGFASDTKVDVSNDLAAVRIGSVLPAPLAIRNTPSKLGEDVAALGFPLSGILSDGVKFTTGNINSLVGMENDTRYLQISTPIQPGNSGGPLIDRRGLVIGINTAQLGTTFVGKTGVLPQNVNFAIKTTALEVFLESNGIKFEQSGDTGPKLETEALAAKVSQSVLKILCYDETEEKESTVNTTVVQPQAPLQPEKFSPPSYFKHFSGTDVIGFDYATLKNVTGGQCQEACERDGRCLATTYNRKAKFCFLKNDAVVLIRNKDANASIHRTKESSVIKAPLSVYSGRDMPGTDYKEIKSAGFVGCVVGCIKDKACLAFSYVRKSGSCWLKGRLGQVTRQSGIDLGVFE